jgi:hypothetical protein
LIEEKYAIQKTEQTKKEKRKREAEKSILFKTTTTRILNSSSSLARRRISNEWQECKTLKKKELISQMTTMLGFSNDDVTKKTIPELREKIQLKLLKDEEELVKPFEREVESISYSST